MAVSLKVKSAIDPSGFNKGIDQMKSKAREIDGAGGSIFGRGHGGGGGGFSFGKGTAAVAAGNLVRDAILAIKDIAMQGGKELRELSAEAKNLSTDIGAINEIQDALGEFGVKGEEVIRMLERIDAARQEAIEGNDKLAESFKEAGVDMDALLKNDAPTLFRKMAESVATGGPTGQAFSGISDVIGKKQAVGMQVPLARYGEGFRKDRMFEPTQRDADILEIAERKKRAAEAAVKNAQARTEAGVVGVTVSEADIQALQKERAQNQANLQALREKAKADADSRRQQEISTKQDKVRAEFGKRMDEEALGVQPERMDVNEFQRVGIGMGGNIDTAAYANGRRQLEIAERNNKLTEEMNAKLAEIAAAVNKTAEASSGGGDF